MVGVHVAKIHFARESEMMTVYSPKTSLYGTETKRFACSTDDQIINLVAVDIAPCQTPTSVISSNTVEGGKPEKGVSHINGQHARRFCATYRIVSS